MRLGTVALILATANVANAQAPSDEPSEPMPPPTAPSEPPPPPPPPGPIVVAPPPVVAAPSTVDPGVIEDANSGRSWLSPTALTPPAGTWSFSDFELLLVSGGYAVTDQLSISATTLLPIVDEMPFFGILSAKLQVIKSGRVRGAAQFAVMHLRENGSNADASLTVANLGGALTLCLDDGCHSHLTGYLGAGFADQDQQAVPFVASAALTYRLGKHVKVVLEADTAFIAGEINETAEGILAWYGLRFTSKMIGVDLGFAKPLCDGCDDGIALGLPFVSFTYRSFKE